MLLWIRQSLKEIFSKTPQNSHGPLDSHRRFPRPHNLAGQGKHRWASWQLLFFPIRFSYWTENETKTTIRTKTIIAWNEHRRSSQEMNIDQSELQTLLQFNSKICETEYGRLIQRMPKIHLCKRQRSWSSDSEAFDWKDTNTCCSPFGIPLVNLSK